MEEIAFTPGSVPVVVVARVYGKDASWVRAGIISRVATKLEKLLEGKLITNIEEMNSRYGRINFTSLRNGFGRKRDICGKERKIKNGHNNSSGIIGENPYWIERHRYYELKHFCLQYPIWKKHMQPWMGLAADLPI